MKKIIKIGSLVSAVALLAACGQESKETEKPEVKKVDTSVEKVVPNVAEKTEAKKIEKTVVAKDIEKSFEIKEGVHYEVIDSELVVDQFDGVTISEFFWLGCPHCQNFEPLVKNWQSVVSEEIPARVVKTAVPGNQRWNLDASVFYTLKEFGASETQMSLMLKLYEAERVKNKSLPDDNDIASFFETLGFDKVEAMKVFKDQDLLSKHLKNANTEYAKIDAQGVPVFVINGKYKIIFNSMESDEQVIETIKQLNAKK